MRASLQRRPALAPSLPARPLPARATRLVVAASREGPRPPAPPLASRLAGAAAAALMLAAASAGPALAELQTVTADQATSMARPLKVQEVKKGRIWLLFVLGASSLFGITVVAENNAAWFPAIARANKAMAMSTKGVQQRDEASEASEAESERFEQRLEEVQAERETDYRLESAVAEGLVAARRPEAAAVDVEAAAVEATAEEAVAAPSVVPVATYPAELDAGVAEAMAAAAEAEDAEWAAAEAAEEAAAAAAASAEAREPLFEIGGDQIEASTKSMQQRVLDGMSLEELQKELEARRGAAAGPSPPQGD